jgi:FMN phosphatase YigB (HAD superfamily)
MTNALVCQLDVDNTLFDNDRFAADLTERLTQGFGAAGSARYWQWYDQRREQLGYADYLGKLEEFRAGQDLNPRLAELSRALLAYPFHRNLYPGVLETLARLSRPPLCDGR